MESARGRIEIDLSAIAHNAAEIKRRIGKTKLLAVVKADAYGHGLVPVAEAALKGGADFLGVAGLEEALALREAGIESPILSLSTILPQEADDAVRHDIRVTVCSLPLLKALDQAAGKQGKKAVVHLKVDTGMGRLGVSPEQAVDFVREARASQNVFVEGIFTHFPSADEEGEGSDFTRKQVETFLEIIRRLEDEGMRPPLRHAANSAATIAHPQSRLDMVRCGLLLYGIWPLPHQKPSWNLRPAMRVVSQVLLVKELPPGHPVSYGRTFVTQRPTKIAVVPIGYHDGYDSRLSNRAQALVRGKRAPVIGRVCMDLLMLDVSEIGEVREGDEVVLLGAQGEERITVEEIASWMQTVPHEFISRIGGRMRRVYVSSEP